MKSLNSKKSGQRRCVIIGVGNLLMKDEGVGIHAVKALQDMGLPENVRTVDGGTSPDLVAFTRPGEKIIIIDAARAGGEPGDIYRLRPEDLADDRAELTSAHQMGVPQNLKLMSLIGGGPTEAVIIGMEPGEISAGLELSPAVRNKLPNLIDIVLQEIG